MNSQHVPRQKPTLPGDSKATNTSLSMTFRSSRPNSRAGDSSTASRSKSSGPGSPAGRPGPAPAARAQRGILNRPEGERRPAERIVPDDPLDRPVRPPGDEPRQEVVAHE